MTVRPLRAHDLDAVPQLCLRAFMASLAPTLGQQGIATFSSIASASAFAERMAVDSAMLVHAHAGGVDGLIEIREGRATSRRCSSCRPAPVRGRAAIVPRGHDHRQCVADFGAGASAPWLRAGRCRVRIARPALPADDMDRATPRRVALNARHAAGLRRTCGHARRLRRTVRHRLAPARSSPSRPPA
jgi:hypothetical protein